MKVKTGMRIKLKTIQEIKEEFQYTIDNYHVILFFGDSLQPIYLNMRQYFDSGCTFTVNQISYDGIRFTLREATSGIFCVKFIKEFI